MRHGLLTICTLFQHFSVIFKTPRDQWNCNLPADNRSFRNVYSLRLFPLLYTLYVIWIRSLYQSFLNFKQINIYQIVKVQFWIKTFFSICFLPAQSLSPSVNVVGYIFTLTLNLSILPTVIFRRRISTNFLYTALFVYENFLQTYEKKLIYANNKTKKRDYISLSFISTGSNSMTSKSVIWRYCASTSETIQFPFLSWTGLKFEPDWYSVF